MVFPGFPAPAENQLFAGSSISLSYLCSVGTNNTDIGERSVIKDLFSQSCHFLWKTVLEVRLFTFGSEVGVSPVLTPPLPQGSPGSSISTDLWLHCIKTRQNSNFKMAFYTGAGSTVFKCLVWSERELHLSPEPLRGCWFWFWFLLCQRFLSFETASWVWWTDCEPGADGCLNPARAGSCVPGALFTGPGAQAYWLGVFVKNWLLVYTNSKSQRLRCEVYPWKVPVKVELHGCVSELVWDVIGIIDNLQLDLMKQNSTNHISAAEQYSNIYGSMNTSYKEEPFTAPGLSHLHCKVSCGCYVAGQWLLATAKNSWRSHFWA